MQFRLTFALMAALVSGCGGDEEASAGGGESPTGETVVDAPPAAPAVTAQVCNANRHTCVMRATGEVYCAGRNLDGELGDGTAQTRWSWVPVQGVAGATQLACGHEHTCAITRSGVRCWGQNATGALGAGHQDVTHEAVAVAGLDDATQLALGDDFSCARRASGAVSCWGEGSSGRLGNGRTEASATPVAVTGLGDVVEISAGRAHACARKTDGSVVCWGAGSSGQLGQGGERPSDSNAPVAAPGVTGATHVAAGGNHSCAITASGVLCWGQNRYGQSGAGEENILTPTAVAGLTGATQLALAESRTCALVADGAVQCWGYNNYTAHLLGVGSDQEKVTAPTAVTGARGLVRISASASGTSAATCGLSAESQLTCWGTAGDGRFGNGAPQSLQTAQVLVPSVDAMSAPASARATFPAAEGTLAARTSFQVGSHTICGVRDGRVYCVGEGSDGRLGHGSTRPNASEQALAADGIEDAVQVTTGLTRTCALRRSGTVACWGQLTPRIQSSLPLPVEGLTDATLIDVGGSADTMTLCAVRADRTVSCAGAPLGVMRETNLTPTPVAGLTDITEVLVGTSSACALAASGKVLCWGSGSYGQLGNGATDSSATPVEVSGIGDAIALGGGGYNHCALRRNGTVSCWGSGDDGQLTNGQTGREANAAAPLPARGLRGAARLGKMGDSMCAALASGEGQCWGANDFGQTGHADAETDDVQAPWAYLRASDPAVAALGPLVEMGCGWNFCCGLHAQGGVSCAGSTPLGGGGGFFGMANRRSPTPIAAPNLTFTIVASE